MADLLEMHGSPERALKGCVRISGAKNAALPMLAATLLTDEPVHLKNIPHLKDITTMCQMLMGLGASILMDDALGIEVHAKTLTSYTAPYDLVKTMRASFLLLGPLLGRFGQAEVSLPGGCAIGSRPVEYHIDALKALGAEIEIKGGYVCARSQGRLQGGEIVFPKETVTGTENALMAACLAEGVTTIQNAAREPEVVDLIQCLNAMGAKIEGAGESTLTITGVKSLHGCEYSVMPDRIEASTFLVAGAISRGRVQVVGIGPELLTSVLEALEAAGAKITLEDHAITLDMEGRQPKAVSIQTAPYPGFPTDVQAQWMVLNCLADGQAEIIEKVFENRFMHVQELKRMGANITLDGQSAFTVGRTHLDGANVMATDLRASACLVLAGAMADGVTHIDRIYHIDRGYEHIEDKMVQLGASIRRI